MAARPSGPLAFRFYLQPIMAVALAVRDGFADAHRGVRPYFWGLCAASPDERRRMMAHGWGSVRRVFLLALVIDLVYQLVVLKRLRPGEGIVIAAVLAIVPYLLTRGPTTRLVRRFGAHPGSRRAT
jgi:hypothetical protein